MNRRDFLKSGLLLPAAGLMGAEGLAASERLQGTILVNPQDSLSVAFAKNSPLPRFLLSQNPYQQWRGLMVDVSAPNDWLGFTRYSDYFLWSNFALDEGWCIQSVVEYCYDADGKLSLLSTAEAEGRIDQRSSTWYAWHLTASKNDFLRGNV